MLPNCERPAMDHEATIERLFAAILAKDAAAARACFTPDAKVWHGYDCVAHDLDSFVAGLEHVFASGMVLRYDDIRRQPTADGFVQQHLFVAHSADGAWEGKPCCNVFHLKDGLIHRVEEYLDRTGVVKIASIPAFTPGI